jgi:RimJ/RimL family protein N-acetyltransferase
MTADGSSRVPPDTRTSRSLSLPLTTERLHLRAHVADDAGWLHRIYSRPDVAQYLLDEPWTTADAAEKAVRRSQDTGLDGETGALSLAVELDGRGIGDVSLWLPEKERRVAEIGWVLDPDVGGRGYAREAAASVLALAFDHYALHRVVAHMDARNHASAKLADAIGMHREGVLRRHWWFKNEWADTLIFGSLSTDRRQS